MIAADKEMLESSLKQRTIAIRDKELTWHESNFVSIATQASLVAGFALSILLVELENFKGANNHVVRLFFYFFTSLAMSLSILAVFNATISNMYGPGLALRGPDGSMHKAVEGMAYERRLTFLYFCGGLICFLMTGMMLAWLILDFRDAGIVTLVIATTLYVLAKTAVRVRKVFHLSAQEKMSGQMMLANFDPATGSVIELSNLRREMDASERPSDHFQTATPKEQQQRQAAMERQRKGTQPLRSEAQSSSGNMNPRQMDLMRRMGLGGSDPNLVHN